MSEAWIIKNITWAKDHEEQAIKYMVGISAVILIGVLIGLWQYGIDLGTVFLGTKWMSASHGQTKGIIALEGAIVAVSLLFGSLLITGIVILAKRRKEAQRAKAAQPAGAEETTKAAE